MPALVPVPDFSYQYFIAFLAGDQLLKLTGSVGATDDVKKMSERQPKAGNQEFQNFGHAEQLLSSCLCSEVAVYW